MGALSVSVLSLFSLSLSKLWERRDLGRTYPAKAAIWIGHTAGLSCSVCYSTRLVMVLERDPRIVSCMGGSDTELRSVVLSRMSKMSKGQQVDK